jgi:hypothetical protein
MTIMVVEGIHAADFRSFGRPMAAGHAINPLAPYLCKNRRSA